ncbi:MAG: hypothetical protein IH895_08690, partial [Planctomycetes bacterium]|nr:hypothetical protein [Planctomycetota bacterium]
MHALAFLVLQATSTSISAPDAIPSGWPWSTIWTAVTALAVVITGAIIGYQAYAAAKALRFEAFEAAQRIFVEPCFLKNRGMVLKKQRALTANEWTGDEREAALDVCRQMDRIAHLFWQRSIKKKRALTAWDDPVGKAWLVLEQLVEHERTKIGWPQKWYAFEFFGAAAIESLNRKPEGPWRHWQVAPQGNFRRPGMAKIPDPLT